MVRVMKIEHVRFKSTCGMRSKTDRFSRQRSSFGRPAPEMVLFNLIYKDKTYGK